MTTVLEEVVLVILLVQKLYNNFNFSFSFYNNEVDNYFGHNRNIFENVFLRSPTKVADTLYHKMNLVNVDTRNFIFHFIYWRTQVVFMVKTCVQTIKFLYFLS